RDNATYEWFINDWVHLIAVHPDTHEFYYFKNGKFSPYNLLNKKVAYTSDITPVIESNTDNIPVYLLA
ncbi:MAG: hypothetical protein K2Q22_06555, partial [Cytophagales bacterium]|nr:hypothetical protein [Cytophagales bacterium]